MLNNQADGNPLRVCPFAGRPSQATSIFSSNNERVNLRLMNAAKRPRYADATPQGNYEEPGGYILPLERVGSPAASDVIEGMSRLQIGARRSEALAKTRSSAINGRRCHQ